MPIEECLVCKSLLIAAGRAIVAHLNALSRLEQAVIETHADNHAALTAHAVDMGIARENAVRAYEEHLASHRKEESARTAGS